MSGAAAGIGAALGLAGTAIGAYGDRKQRNALTSAANTGERALKHYGKKAKRLATYGQETGKNVGDEYQRMLAAFTGTMPGEGEFAQAQAARGAELSAAQQPAWAGAQASSGNPYQDRFTRALIADRMGRAQAAAQPMAYAGATGDQQLAESRATGQLQAGGQALTHRAGQAGSLAQLQDAIYRKQLAAAMGYLPANLARAQGSGFWQQQGGSALQQFGVGMMYSGGGGGGMGGYKSSFSGQGQTQPMYHTDTGGYGTGP